MQTNKESVDTKKNKRYKLFGERAVELGLITAEQLNQALEDQVQKRDSGKDILLGMIMLDLGILDNSGLLSVLKTYEAATALE